MRRVSEEERKLFKAVIEQARPVKKSAPKIAPTLAAAKPAKNLGGLDGGTQARLRRGALEPQARLDLHGYTEEAAHGALLSFLRKSRRRGDRLVLVVTGKGAKLAPDAPFDLSAPRRGVLKAAVPRWLNESVFAALIANVSPAHRSHGGAGALYIYLRKNR
ncbi:MAG TPA: Smr/MutS family protein [Rhizomicrobium sp.]